MEQQSYEEFAQVYDELMDQVPYEAWAEKIVRYMETYGITKPDRSAADALDSERNLVLDLGCGTGTLSRILYDKGYDMMGADGSDAMLEVAMEKRGQRDILYFLQDMRDLSLYSTVGTVVCVCDTLNYILEEEELLQVFRLVNNYLYPQGVFLFDFNTVYKYEKVIGDATIAENREDVSFIWENFYDSATRENQCDLTLFVREGEHYAKYEETHVQRGYTPAEIEALLQKAGLELICMTDADTEGAVTDETQRVFAAVREHGKEL